MFISPVRTGRGSLSDLCSETILSANLDDCVTRGHVIMFLSLFHIELTVIQTLYFVVSRKANSVNSSFHDPEKDLTKSHENQPVIKTLVCQG